MANVTEDGNFSSKPNEALNAPPESIPEFLSALHIVVSITATLGNALTFAALHKQHKFTSIHPPTRLSFRCLAVTDLFVGLIVQPLYTTYIMFSKLALDENDLSYLVDKVCLICLDIGRNKCGQTSRVVVRTEIQTCRVTLIRVGVNL